MRADTRPATHTLAGRAPADGPGAPLVTMRHLDIGYDRSAVLKDVSLEIRRGEFVGIVGPSGVGKTSILRAILGQAQRLGGSLEMRAPGGRRSVRVGYVPQVEEVDWNFPITVIEAVLLGRWREMGPFPWSRKEDRRLAHEVLARLDIDQLAGRQIRALSGGQQQRVFLARALIGNPDLLLLDEPTSGVDIRTRHDVMHLLGELNRGGVTIMLTTHELNAVATHLPRIICIGEGHIAADGRPADILTPPILRRVYGADMMVFRRDGAIYVVEHAGPLDAEHLMAEEALAKD